MMTDTTQHVQPPGTVAPLNNVSLCYGALKKSMERKPHLPGIVAFYGDAGLGKSTAAAWAANKTRAYYVEAKSTWTNTALTTSILREMGIAPKLRTYEQVEQVAEELMLSERPLIIDEFDHLVNKRAVEIVRDIFESSNAAILLIGEEQMPNKLKRWERFHSRILRWQPAQPTDIEDLRHLAALYCDRVQIADDLLQKINKSGRGSARRAAINLEDVREQALAAGLTSADAMWWGDRPLYTGEAPSRRG